MIIVDTVTHRLVNRHIMSEVYLVLNDGHEAVTVVATKDRMKTLVHQIRVEMSRMYREENVPKEDRFGIRASESIPWSLSRGEDIKCEAVVIRRFNSQLKAIQRAMSSSCNLNFVGV